MGLSGHADPAAVLGVTISFTVVATFAVALRLYSRIFIVHSPGKDDAFIAAACAMTICLTIAQCFQGSSVRDHPVITKTKRNIEHTKLTHAIANSQVRHGPALRQFDTLRETHLRKTLLGFDHHLQPRTIPLQILHPLAIPANIPVSFLILSSLSG
jgi:hypothetical protein